MLHASWDLPWYKHDTWVNSSSMAKDVVVAVDSSPAAHEALLWTLRNLVKDADIVHLVHCFSPLKPIVGAIVSFHPSGRHCVCSYILRF